MTYVLLLSTVYVTCPLHIRYTYVTVDHLLYVCGILKADLKTDAGKELFLYYHATLSILTHVKTSNKVALVISNDGWSDLGFELTSILVRYYIS